MKKLLIVCGGAILILLLAWRQETASALLSLLITGHLPGTSWAIPFWAMMAIYCLLITVIVTRYVEDAFAFRRANRATPHKSHMPHRRYSHI
jgi:hypothetical protein